MANCKVCKKSYTTSNANNKKIYCSRSCELKKGSSYNSNNRSSSDDYYYSSPSSSDDSSSSCD